MLIAVPDHLPQACASGSQVLLEFLDVIGKGPELGQLAFEFPVGFGEFVDPLGQAPVADLVELMPEVLAQGGAKLIAFRAEFFDLFAGHGQVGVETGRPCVAALSHCGDGILLLPLDGCLDMLTDALGIDEPR